jgi:drug/metabolite transporter (DMT)-like permease
VFLLLVRLARTPRFDYYTAGLTNYAAGAIVALALLAGAGLSSFSVPAVLLGAINGWQYLSTFLFMFVLIGLAGIAVTSGFLRLSVAVPVLASIAIWGEWPTPPQTVGLVLAGLALPLLGSRSGRRRQVRGKAHEGETEHSPLAIATLVVVTILISGSGLLAAKAFAELHQPDQRPVYIAAVYVTATLFGLAVWPWRGRLRPSLPPTSSVAPARVPQPPALAPSLVLGVVIGLVNVGQLLALLPALAVVPGVIAFPLSSAGGLALATLGAWLFWREPLGGRTGVGIALAMAAGVLVNAD